MFQLILDFFGLTTLSQHYLELQKYRVIKDEQLKTHQDLIACYERREVITEKQLKVHEELRELYEGHVASLKEENESYRTQISELNKVIYGN